MCVYRYICIHLYAHRLGHALLVRFLQAPSSKLLLPPRAVELRLERRLRPPAVLCVRLKSVK